MINTENKRIDNGKDGWSGHVDLGLSLVQNTKQILQGNSQVQARYQKGRDMLLLLNDVSLIQVDQDDLLNRGYQHVRYNHEVRPYLIPEAFVQVQYDQIWKLDMRFLAGAGPRFRLVRNDTVRAYVGTLVMYEYEEVAGGQDYNRDFRLSSYVALGYKLQNRLSVDHISYFQPLLQDWADFRVSTETNVRVGVGKHFGLKVGFNLNYDARPPEGLPKRIYGLVNGVSWVF